MINFVEIRNHIVSGLNQHLNKLVILLNPDAPKPPKPYLTYKFTSPLIPGGIMTNEDIQTFVNNVKYTNYRQDTITLSIQCYSDNEDESIVLTQQAHDWFYYNSGDYLREKSIVIAELMNVTNREFQIVDHWERRHGFDVILRVVNKHEKVVTTIETVSFDENGS